MTPRRPAAQISRSFLLPLLGACLLLPAAACEKGGSPPPQAKKRYVAATDATLVPMSFVNDRNRLDGFEIDLMNEIARTAGIDVELVNVEWAGLFGGLLTRKYDMAIASVTVLEERRHKMAFSIPYLQSGLALVVRKETEGVNSIEDAERKFLLVGAQTGTTAYFFLEKYPGIRKKGYQLYGHAIADLIKGEIDAVVGESSGTLYYKNQNREYFEKIKMAGEILTEEYYGIVLRKEDAELLKKINGALKRLLENGFVRQLHGKWELGQAAAVPPVLPEYPVGKD